MKNAATTYPPDKLIKPVQCEACGTTYDYIDEPAEVKEGGTHICSDCWNK